jgi:hypothetical protein
MPGSGTRAFLEPDHYKASLRQAQIDILIALGPSSRPKRLRHGAGLIPIAPSGGAVRLSPVLARITGEKLFCGPGVACKIAAKNEESQRIAPLGHGAAKAANRGAKRPEQRGQKRQQGSNRVDKAVSEHAARSHLSEVTSCTIRCEFVNFSVGRESEDHLGRPPAHERPRAARARPNPAATARACPRLRFRGARTFRGGVPGGLRREPADHPATCSRGAVHQSVKSVISA